MTPRTILFVGAASLVGVIGWAGPSSAANIAKGKTIFEHRCHTCHRIGPGAVNFVGPDLNGLEGRPIASEPGYSYSDADKKKKKDGWVWTKANFLKYITNPDKVIHGTKMIFPGISRAKDREDLWAYVSQFNKDGSMKKK